MYGLHVEYKKYYWYIFPGGSLITTSVFSYVNMRCRMNTAVQYLIWQNRFEILFLTTSNVFWQIICFMFLCVSNKYVLITSNMFRLQFWQELQSILCCACESRNSVASRSCIGRRTRGYGWMGKLKGIE